MQTSHLNLSPYGCVKICVIDNLIYKITSDNSVTPVCGLQSIRGSEVVEVSPDQLWLRTRFNPERWAIEGTAPNTFSTLKVDVPEFVPGQIYFNVQETGRT